MSRCGTLFGITPRHHAPIGRNIIGRDIQRRYEVSDSRNPITHAKQGVGTKDVAVALRQRPDAAAPVGEPKRGRDVATRERQRTPNLEFLMMRQLVRLDVIESHVIDSHFAKNPGPALTPLDGGRAE
jgi:hypothetical protein